MESTRKHNSVHASGCDPHPPMLVQSV